MSLLYFFYANKYLIVYYSYEIHIYLFVFLFSYKIKPLKEIKKYDFKGVNNYG